MNEKLFGELPAWLTKAGLAGTPDTDIFSGFCDRCVAAGMPLGRAHLFIDTLHPVHEGRLFRWGFGPDETAMHEYGRTSVQGVDASDPAYLDQQASDIWRRSPFFQMLQTGAALLRRRLTAETKDEFSLLPDWHAAGMTDYLAIISRFAAEGIIGEMDGVYSSWATREPQGFDDRDIAALERVVPYLALAIKSVSLVRMTRTLMETYLGRDAGQRVLGGRIVRGIAERIDAVVWFSDLRGFTRITDTAPEQVIPLLNDYADVIVSAIEDHGGDVLKLIGDGTLAIFTAEDRAHACERGAGRRARRAPRRRRIEQAPQQSGPARHRHVSRPARRQGVLRQCRQPRAARLHRARPGRERSKPHRRHVPLGRSAHSVVGGVRRRRRHEKPPRLGRALRAPRRLASAGAVHDRSRIGGRSPRLGQ